MSDLKIEITSPHGSIFKGSYNLAVVPSVEGEIGVMFGHESFVANLKQGRILIYDDKQNLVKDFEVETGGFAEVKDGATLLVLID